MPLLRPCLLLTTPPESSDLAVGTPRAELIGVCVLCLAGRRHGLIVTQVTLLLYARPLWLISSATLPLHGGVSPQRMIECVWRRYFDDAIDWDIVMTLLGRLKASVLMLMSVCSPASPATADICCTLFCRRNRSNTIFYANDLMATNFRNTHPLSMTVIF